MADNMVIFTNKLSFVEAANLNKVFVYIGNFSFKVGGGFSSCSVPKPINFNCCVMACF
jgi:hypothetical protein